MVKAILAVNLSFYNSYFLKLWSISRNYNQSNYSNIWFAKIMILFIMMAQVLFFDVFFEKDPHLNAVKRPSMAHLWSGQPTMWITVWGVSMLQVKWDLMRVLGRWDLILIPVNKFRKLSFLVSSKNRFILHYILITLVKVVFPVLATIKRYLFT